MPNIKLNGYQGSANSSLTFPAYASFTLALAIAIATYGPHEGRVMSDFEIRTGLHQSVDHSTSVLSIHDLERMCGHLRERISSFSALDDNWDGDDGIAPSASHVNELLKVLSSLPVDILAFGKPLLAADGEVGVYWSRGDLFADLTIDSDGDLSLYTRDLRRPNGSNILLNDTRSVDPVVIKDLRTHLAQPYA